MTDEEFTSKRADEATVKRAAELLGVPVEGRYLQDILADVVLKLAEKEAARG